MNAPAYSSAGVKSAQKATLPKDIFDVTIKNHELIKTAYNAYLANGRANLATTKTRGDVRGGGRKPWRQKGTGRARFGSSRNPIWKGGGIAFGPTGNENFTVSMPLKAKRLALKQSLKIAADSSKVSVIEDISLKTAKTADLNKLVSKIEHQGSTLIVVDKISKELDLASRNLPDVTLSTASLLNVFDILNADHLILTKPAIKALGERLGSEA